MYNSYLKSIRIGLVILSVGTLVGCQSSWQSHSKVHNPIGINSSPADAEWAPSAKLVPAKRLAFKKDTVDSNSPAFWIGDKLHIVTSVASFFLNFGDDLDSTVENNQRVPSPFVNNSEESLLYPFLEATWRAPNGNIYGWYHHEYEGGVLCPNNNKLTAPRIGAVVSYDQGKSWENLGFVLSENPILYKCNSQNDYFAGGTGDFSVYVDETRNKIFFIFGTYGGEAEDQGISLAQMPLGEIDNPVGKVTKWFNGSWEQPGIEGYSTPVFRGEQSWHSQKPKVFWGPSVHWNHYLKCFVILLNKTRNVAWNQEGIFISYAQDLEAPESWAKPVLLSADLGWYPQVIGTEKFETDSYAGQMPRYFVHGVSEYVLEFGFVNRSSAPIVSESIIDDSKFKISFKGQGFRSNDYEHKILCDGSYLNIKNIECDDEILLVNLNEEIQGHQSCHLTISGNGFLLRDFAFESNQLDR